MLHYNRTERVEVANLQVRLLLLARITQHILVAVPQNGEPRDCRTASALKKQVHARGQEGLRA